jgi:hypothetical protein
MKSIDILDGFIATGSIIVLYIVYMCLKSKQVNEDGISEFSSTKFGANLYSHFSCFCPQFLLKLIAKCLMCIGEIGDSCQSTIYMDDADIEASNLANIVSKMNKKKKQKRKPVDEESGSDSDDNEVNACDVDSTHSDTPMFIGKDC